jgi:hypothetical protein
MRWKSSQPISAMVDSPVPYGLAQAPVIKVATRTELSRRWSDLIDLDAGRIADHGCVRPLATSRMRWKSSQPISAMVDSPVAMRPAARLRHYPAGLLDRPRHALRPRPGPGDQGRDPEVEELPAHLGDGRLAGGDAAGIEVDQVRPAPAQLGA